MFSDNDSFLKFQVEIVQKLKQSLTDFDKATNEKLIVKSIQTFFLLSSLIAHITCIATPKSPLIKNSKPYKIGNNRVGFLKEVHSTLQAMISELLIPYILMGSIPDTLINNFIDYCDKQIKKLDSILRNAPKDFSTSDEPFKPASELSLQIIMHIKDWSTFLIRNRDSLTEPLNNIYKNALNLHGILSKENPSKFSLKNAEAVRDFQLKQLMEFRYKNIHFKNAPYLSFAPEFYEQLYRHLEETFKIKRTSTNFSALSILFFARSIIKYIDNLSQIKNKLQSENILMSDQTSEHLKAIFNITINMIETIVRCRSKEFIKNAAQTSSDSLRQKTETLQIVYRKFINEINSPCKNVITDFLEGCIQLINSCIAGNKIKFDTLKKIQDSCSDINTKYHSLFKIIMSIHKIPTYEESFDIVKKQINNNPKFGSWIRSERA